MKTIPRIACQALAALALTAEGAAARSAPSPTATVTPAKVVATHPHDRSAFTEGLLFKDGRLYESTGMEGASDIREVRLADGRMLRRAAIPSRHFGEGLVDWRDEFLSVTWRTGVGYRWDARTFRLKSTFRYPGEGWGMTRKGDEIALSDGTSTLRFMDAATFKERRRVSVSFQGRPVTQLNELEWVDGEILANVWTTSLIARIDPATGEIRSWIDVSATAALQPGTDPNAVPNGIAWDAARRRLYVTGKNWGAVYEVEVAGLTGPRRRR